MIQAKGICFAIKGLTVVLACCLVSMAVFGCTGADQTEEPSTLSSTETTESSQPGDDPETDRENRVIAEDFTIETPENWEWTGGNEPAEAPQNSAMLTRQLQPGDLPDTSGYMFL